MDGGVADIAYYRPLKDVTVREPSGHIERHVIQTLDFHDGDVLLGDRCAA
jgi:hypothetical protein